FKKVPAEYEQAVRNALAASGISLNPTSPPPLPANQAPTVSITSPLSGATFTAPANITINANASDSDGSISQVEFYQGSTLLGTDTTSPYSFAWNNVAAGSYSLTAKAKDNAGAVTTSSAISITVNAPPPSANQPPTVSITSPANNATFTAPANITIDANASDSDGSISQVEFYQGSTLLGTDTNSPYSFAWNNVAAGSYSLTAKAKDNAGAVTTSSAINITVNAATSTPPPSSRTSTNVAVGKTVTASASASNLSKVTDGEVKIYESVTEQSYAIVFEGMQWIKIDLGQSYSIDRIRMWHYYGDGRTYRDVVVQVSNTADFSSGVVTVFNNDRDNSGGQGVGNDAEYAETSAGKEIVLSTPTNARYVRLWSNGSNANAGNHYVEVEVYGK
ncbi:MAG TPA: Ig-like domain-containing protein, partial [Blastocatellia bacterium]|nr:Ig-like domain-containing protein [Blastocatellia bacterium]